MKLFTDRINKQLFKQFSLGGDLEKQNVVCKIFNPFGRGTWYIINSDPDDPDYMWCIADLFEVEVGSCSRRELESYKGRFGLGLERDLYFEPINAAKCFKSLTEGSYDYGGEVGNTVQFDGKVFTNDFGIPNDKFLKIAAAVKRTMEQWSFNALYRMTNLIQSIDGGAKAAKYITKFYGGGVKTHYPSKEMALQNAVGVSTWEKLEEKDRLHLLEEEEFTQYYASGGMFDTAKAAPPKSKAAKEKPKVEVSGMSEKIYKYHILDEMIKNNVAEKDILGGEIKDVARGKFLEQYKKQKSKPDTFTLADGDDSVDIQVKDTYIKVTPEREALLETYDGLLETTTTYSFDNDVLQRNRDVIEKLLMGTKLISDEDKKNMLTKKTVTEVKKGSINRILDYDNPNEIFELIEPVVAITVGK